MSDRYCELAEILAKRTRIDLWKFHQIKYSPKYDDSDHTYTWLELWEKLCCKNSCKQAAVLVPLFEKDKIIHILLTRRTDKVEYHKGEISFPGGARDPGDATLVETALRETSEEVGIPQENIRVLGLLDDAFTLVSKFVVTPYLAKIEYPYSIHLNQDETKEILEIPLDFFMKKQNFWTGSFPYQGYAVQSYFFQWKSDVIVWGLTAFIIKNLCDILQTDSFF